jgi:RNA polymerase sigma factor (TIGR02999 family)
MASDVTRILTAIDEGDAQAAEELVPLVYDELRRLADQRLQHEKPGQTLQATALVHEAYIRLVGEGDHPWGGRANIFSAAAEAMRRILIERTRRRHSLKRGADRHRIDLDNLEVAAEDPVEEIVEISDVLDELAKSDDRAAELVKLRFFAGFTIDEAAEILGVTPRTALG